MHIDWAYLSQDLDCEFKGGDFYARQALAAILGDEAIEEAVDYYISGRSGSELARSVLWYIHPQFGMDYCYRIFKQETDLNRRRSAVELLRVIANKSALKWVPEFLNDPDESIQALGAEVVDQLLWSNFIDEEDCRDILDSMKVHKSSSVRRCFELISESIARSSCQDSTASNDR